MLRPIKWIKNAGGDFGGSLQKGIRLGAIRKGLKIREEGEGGERGEDKKRPRPLL